MTLTYMDLLAIGGITLLGRPLIAIIRFIARIIGNIIAEKLLEKIHGKDMAAVMIAQSAEEPVEQLIRAFVAPGTIKLDNERRPIKRSNVGR